MFTRRHSAALLARAKGGMRVWSPTPSYNTKLKVRDDRLNPRLPGRSGNRLNGGVVTPDEMYQLLTQAYPLEDTIEHEDDLGHSQLFMREYHPKRARFGVRTSTADQGLVFSSTERIDAQKQLARAQKKYKAEAMIKLDPNDASLKELIHEEGTGPAAGVGPSEITLKYLFDGKRMDYVKRFLDRMKPVMDEDPKGLNPVVEACAILYGCKTDEAKEAWLTLFLQLDRDSLAEETEKLRGLMIDAKDVLNDKMLFSKEVRGVLDERTGMVSLTTDSADRDGVEEDFDGGDDNDEEFIYDDSDEMNPPLLEDGGGEKYAAVESELEQVQAEEHLSDSLKKSREVLVKEELPSLAQMAEYAPLYKSYAAFIRGQSPVVDLKLGVNNQGVFKRAAERARWRKLIETLVREEYDAVLSPASGMEEEEQSLDLYPQDGGAGRTTTSPSTSSSTISKITITPQEWKDLINLSKQLETVRLVHAKMGETVKDAVDQQRRTLSGEVGSTHRGGGAAFDRMSSNPEVRQSY